MGDHHWQFWIDVGGTFTDCYALARDGSLRRHKLLSSGVTKGRIERVLAAPQTALVDPARRSDPQQFWRGYVVRLLDRQGRAIDQTTVTDFDAPGGRLTLAERLDISAGQAYELVSDEDAPIVGLRYLLGLRRDQQIPKVSVRLGTTRGTNALITRCGAKTALITTRGFGDILRIGYQNRPRLFELAIRKAPPLFAEVVEVDQRVTVAGEVLLPLDRSRVRHQLESLWHHGIESLAICLLNAYAHPEHELQIEQLARAVGFHEISLSHQVAPLIKIVSRGDTTVLDAYLNPVLRLYVERLRRSLGTSDLRILSSAGGLVQADQYAGKDSILSGPAGGVVGFSRVAEAAGFQRAIGFDMGGTSTDVSRYDGRYELEYEAEKAGVRVVAPMLAIETVAAGGGSICRFDGVKLVVGPESAAAEPGPACYGRGGPLAVTDVNFYLGKILPDYFPFPLDRQAVQKRLDELIGHIEKASGTHYSPAELADGLLRIANANMVKAIRSISIAKGYDPADYVLVCFGGAAAQHACAVADELGIGKILNHPDAGILSAYGIGMADVVKHRAAGIYQTFDAPLAEGLEATFAQLQQAAWQDVRNEGVAPERIEIARALDLRYQGMDACLTIPCPASGDYAAAYRLEHQRLYGYQHQRPMEAVAARVVATGRSDTRPAMSGPAPPRRASAVGASQVFFDGGWLDADVFVRSQLRPGDRLAGPAIVVESHSTTVLDPGWQADTLQAGELLITRQPLPATGTATRRQAARAPRQADRQADPVLLEVFNNQFAAIAEQMGITLRNTSSSVNVKERLDFSCAVFTASGDLVVNAPHIPVHLGAMSQTVRCILNDNPVIRPGDVFVTNDPLRGGSHLPDITVVTGVFDPRGQGPGRLLFFTASRAHHAEIGGITPGSMPPFSKNLAEEGVLIRNFKVVDQGVARTEQLRSMLLAGPYPTRSVDDNLADIAAQIAANHQGARDLLKLADQWGLELVQAYTRHIQQAAERKMRAALSRLPRRRHHFLDHLDDGTAIAVTIHVQGTSAIIDFTGTGPVHAGNLNANPAIVTAAVMYCLRCLIDEDIPLNQGVLAPIQLVFPQCLLNPPVRDQPSQCAAVAGGNVETSQRVVDVLLGALGVAAASQGTMNNLCFGDETFGYYETICGGSGATPELAGADAVHTHMTNTRLTDPEVLEQRYPVRVVEFSIRRGSGGAGQLRGGHGVVRRLQFLRRLDVSILSQRRGPYLPYGLAGGQPGRGGENHLRRAAGQQQRLGGHVQLQVEAGDVLTIKTPGGGGYGPAASS